MMSWAASDFIEEGERRCPDIQGSAFFGGLSSKLSRFGKKFDS